MREPWLGDPTRALVTGVMGLLLPPVRLSVHPAASRGPRVLRSLRFQPSPENSTAGKQCLWYLCHLINIKQKRYLYLLNDISTYYCAIVKLSKFIHFCVSRFEYLRNLHNLVTDYTNAFSFADLPFRSYVTSITDSYRLHKCNFFQPKHLNISQIYILHISRFQYLCNFQ